MAAALVIAVTSLGATGVPAPSAESSSAGDLTRRVIAPKCSAHKAVRFYSRRINEHRARMGAAQSTAKAARAVREGGCPRYLAGVLQRKARAWRLRAERWEHYHFAWSSWLPANWRRLGACETGYGREPGNWRHDSGTHVSAFGITRYNYANNAARIGLLSWDETRRRLGRYPTPREQYENALSHLRTHGDGWTCPGP